MSGKPHPSASLYVGDLGLDVSEGMLFETFNQVGPVASIRVCRHAVTRRSLGYAYVNFHSVVDAERALDTLNNTEINDKTCRIMWSQRDPAVRKSGVGNIFIKNLDPSIGHKELHDTFSIFGNILSCKVASDPTAASKGYGFVHFENAESAQKAIEKVNGMIMGSKTVYVGPFVPKKERLKTKASSWTNVYLKNIDKSWDEAKLKEVFARFGDITSAVVMSNDAGENRGFGFVNFTHHDDAVKCVEHCTSDTNEVLNGDGVPVWAGRAQKRTERQAELKKKFEQQRMERMTKYQGINLYIKNLEDDINEERLKKEFSPFGTVKSVKIMSDDKGNTKGFGFVCFSTPEEAQQAISEMNGRILSNCKKPLYVNLHEPKEVRRQKLAAQYAARVKGMPARPPPASAPFVGPNMFYGPPGNMPQMLGYPQQMIPRSRHAAWGGPAPAQGYQMPPNYVVGVPQGGRRGGRQGMPQGGRRGPPRGGQAAPQGGRPQAPAQPGAPPAAAQPGPSVAGGDPQPAAPQQQPFHNQPLTKETLSTFPKEQRKFIVGEKLYPIVHARQPELAGKITGMLLDAAEFMDELLHLLDDEEALDAKVEEAVSVLRESRVAAEAAETEAPAEDPAEETPADEAE
mmetsp:Transcript_301/g.315  ORF Transcript_301/g.315 Transcript_301/m.315 type:complete len:628 (+) Transcript_301:90-1973(+)